MRARLTPEQLDAITSPAACLYIEAAPGSGKTTVAAHRFAAERFRQGFAYDQRGVIAVSFTRAATRELRARVGRAWGPHATRFPHRVVTLDTLVADLLRTLLRQGLVCWPGGHTDLEVHDSWGALVESTYSNRLLEIRLVQKAVTPRVIRSERQSSRPSASQVKRRIEAGVCTHEDVRSVLDQALTQAAPRELLINRIASTTRALIVDEVFDANELDLAVVDLAIAAGVDVTLIGDPWQALYRFRGARPDLVPELIDRTETTERPLTHSFRWKSSEQAELARQLRSGEPVTLSAKTPEDQVGAVLATRWADLWELDASVLPLAFGAAKGNIAEAAATLLLDHVTRSILQVSAVYTGDACSTLRIACDELLQLEAEWPHVLAELQEGGETGGRAGYVRLVEVLARVSDAEFPSVRRNYTRRLEALAERLAHPGNLIPGLTIHQAKGREWDTVGVAFNSSHHETLLRGLSVTEPLHRQLYVGCTRARYRTVAMQSA